MSSSKPQRRNGTSDVDQWNFPAHLCGNLIEVRTFAKLICRSAVENETWRDVWAACERRSVLQTPADIFVSDHSGFYKSREVLWRINQVHMGLQRETVRQNKRDTYYVLVEELLDQLWFCVTMLDEIAWPRIGPADSDAAHFRRGVRAIVSFLPEISALGDRIANSVSPEISLPLRKIPLMRIQWASGLLDLCQRLGHPVEVPFDIEDDQWSLTDALAAAGVLRVNGNRYEPLL